ncbi:MAG TPA: GNAT family N-acetyltransferase [Polyangiaceae bacterium]|nr:GNAT family N-acetyltransferase [Polyangiaceae bacterium]
MLASERLSIRPYHRDDDPFIAALAHEAFDEYTPYAVPHTLGMVRRCTTLVALRERVPRAAGAVAVRARGSAEPPSERASDPPPRVAEGASAARPVARERVGFAAISDEGEGVLMLNAIAVLRGERGRGIGHYLMQAFERFGRVRGARRLELCTADYNLAALELFFRHGFRLLRRRERFYDRGQDACVLVKDLR